MGKTYISDEQALNAIQQEMSGKEWSPDTLDQVADILRMSGREIKDS